jgi:hypothetical protein
MLPAPGEAESGSAGVQPDKEYPGRRCADGASGPWSAISRGLFVAIGHRSYAFKTHQDVGSSIVARVPSRLGCSRLVFRDQAILPSRGGRPCTYEELSRRRFMKITERSKKVEWVHSIYWNSATAGSCISRELHSTLETQLSSPRPLGRRLGGRRRHHQFRAVGGTVFPHAGQRRRQTAGYIASCQLT